MHGDQSRESRPLANACEDAQARYRRGVVALVAGRADAEECLREALAFEPTFFLAQVGIAAMKALGGNPYTAPEQTVDILRGERQHAEIMACAFAGHHRRAADLRREHLYEYPDDLLIIWLPGLLAR